MPGTTWYGWNARRWRRWTRESGGKKVCRCFWNAAWGRWAMRRDATGLRAAGSRAYIFVLVVAAQLVVHAGMACQTGALGNVVRGENGRPGADGRGDLPGVPRVATVTLTTARAWTQAAPALACALPALWSRSCCCRIAPSVDEPRRWRARARQRRTSPPPGGTTASNVSFLTLSRLLPGRRTRRDGTSPRIPHVSQAPASRPPAGAARRGPLVRRDDDAAAALDGLRPLQAREDHLGARPRMPERPCAETRALPRPLPGHGLPPA